MIPGACFNKQLAEVEVRDQKQSSIQVDLRISPFSSHLSLVPFPSLIRPSVFHLSHLLLQGFAGATGIHPGNRSFGGALLTEAAFSDSDRSFLVKFWASERRRPDE